MFRTISGAVLNQSTSVWLSTRSLILPFWPIGSSGSPIGSNMTIGSHSEQWQAPTTVYQTSLDCIPMSMSDQYNTSLTYIDYTIKPVNRTTNGTAVRMDSSDGCSITLVQAMDRATYDFSWLARGGGWWAHPNSFGYEQQHRELWQSNHVLCQLSHAERG